MIGHTAIRKWGNSQGVVIPKDILNQMQWAITDILQMETQGEILVVKKQHIHKTLEDRLRAYGGKLNVTEYDWGEPIGKEVL